MNDEPPLEYTLSPAAARARARVMAAWSAGGTALPPVLVIVLIAQMDLAPLRIIGPIAALVLVLGVVRGVLGYRGTARRLGALAVALDPESLSIRTVRDALRIVPTDVTRIVDVDGPLGGLRLELRESDDLPARIDLPRGGARFADLRAALAIWRPIDRTPRRRRITRFAFGVMVVLGIFFMPFFVDDVVGRSRIAACAMIVALWAVMRAVLSRRS